MSLFSFFKKNKESYSLVFSIGSGSVSGGLIKFTDAPGENLLYYSKEKIPFQQEISVSKHLDLMKSSLDILVNRIYTDGVHKINQNHKSTLKIDKVFCVFSSPWSASHVKTIRIKEPKPIKITEEYLNKYINEQEKQLKLNMSTADRVIEKKIIQMKINGYLVNDFYNRQAKDIEFSVHFTVAPEEVLQVVEKMVAKTFHIKDIWCHSLSLSIFSIIRNLFPQKDDCIHIDVGDEVTDISVINDGLMTVSASIPLGRNHYIRELSTVLNVTEEIADSMIRMKNQKITNELATLKLAVSMDKAAANWLTKIFEVLDNLKIKICLPDTVFLITSGDLLSFLKEKLTKHNFTVMTLENRKIKPPIVIDDLPFKLVLMFLDNLYKI